MATRKTAAKRKKITRPRPTLRPHWLPKVRLSEAEDNLLRALFEHHQSEEPLTTLSDWIRSRLFGIASATQPIPVSTPVGTRKQGVAAKKK